jgi:hypothetical protein
MCITNFGRHSSKLIATGLTAIRSANNECIFKAESKSVSKSNAVQPLACPESICQEKPKSVTKRLPPGLTTKNHQRRFVQHHYRDHSGDNPLDKEEEMIQNTLQCVENKGSYVVRVDSEALNSVKRDPRGGVPVPFPLKLHELLDAIEADGHADVLSWQPHGRSFRVHKIKEFVEKVMPRYFRQSKLTSFQRQLNLYGFARITKGQDKGGYYHELFLRGKLFLANRIARNKVKGTKIKAVTSPETEPEFYSMPFIDVTSGSPKLVSSPKIESADEDLMSLKPLSPLPTGSADVCHVSVKVSSPFEPNNACSSSTCTANKEDASFEGMPFHLISLDQLSSECDMWYVSSAAPSTNEASIICMPSRPQASHESSSSSDDGSSLIDLISDVLMRGDDETFKKKFDILTISVPALSLVSEELSSLDDDDCSLSVPSMKRCYFEPAVAKSNSACMLGNTAIFEGMPFYVIVPEQSKHQYMSTPLPNSPHLLRESSLISVPTLASIREDLSLSDAEDCSIDYCVSDVLSLKNCADSFDELLGSLYKDEEMCPQMA